MSPIPLHTPKASSRVPPRPSSDLTDIRASIERIGADAREARDGVVRLTAIVAASDANASIAALSASMREQHSALRADVVLAITNIRTDVKDIDVRVENLEEARAQHVGGSALMKLLRDSIAWLVALVVSFVALFDHLNHPK